MVTLYFNMPVKAVQSVRFSRAGHAYQPKDVMQYKSTIAALARQQLNGMVPFSGAVGIRLIYVFKVLKSFPKWKIDIIKNGGKIYKITKPDITDNTQKALIDSLAGILFKQDQQICKITGIEKVYGLKDQIQLKAWEIKEIQD